MAILKMQCSFAADDTLPRNLMVITPHFKAIDPLGDEQALVDDLADALDAKLTATSGSRQVTVTAYNAEGPPPHFPLATKTNKAGVAPAGGTPRELCVCLSYYSEHNAPRYRGRLYLPHILVAAGNPGLRPSAGERTNAGAFATIFADLGGIDVDWVVYSRRDSAARSVSNWWVDDEWDIQRRRGLKSTTRLTGTLSE